jgi:hypothetical protein
MIGVDIETLNVIQEINVRVQLESFNMIKYARTRFK